MNAKKGRKREAWRVDGEINLDSILTLSSETGRCLRQTEHEAVKQVIIAEPERMVMTRCLVRTVLE
jgi:hypothetical protein